MRLNLALLFAVIGAIAGLLIVRFYFLNQLQIIGWNLFWDNLTDLNFRMFKLVFKSKTFGKCLAGFFTGAAAGGFLGYALSKKK